MRQLIYSSFILCVASAIQLRLSINSFLCYELGVRGFSSDRVDDYKQFIDNINYDSDLEAILRKGNEWVTRNYPKDEKKTSFINSFIRARANDIDFYESFLARIEATVPPTEFNEINEWLWTKDEEGCNVFEQTWSNLGPLLSMISDPIQQTQVMNLINSKTPSFKRTPKVAELNKYIKRKFFEGCDLY